MNTNKKKCINITNPSNCCGCGSCANICPNQCILMHPDNTGCLYPRVEKSSCIDCGACVKVCPFVNKNERRVSISCYAAVNKNNEERLKSSSGGVFIALAKEIIRNGGVVFGAVYDENWKVYHTSAESMENLIPMMGSKYVQSDTRFTYVKTLNYLKDGRMVLYTGTPCQIAGLKQFLRKEYSNLLTVEVVCHGVPAPEVWQSYIKEIKWEIDSHNINANSPMQDKLIKNNKPTIQDISFRNKEMGWREYSIEFVIVTGIKDKNQIIHKIQQPHYDNDYMKVFLRNWSLRPSCYNCKAKNGYSHADITIGDYWGIEHNSSLPDDNKGTSCVVVRSLKAQKILHDCNLILVKSSISEILHGNPYIEISASINESEQRFKRLVLKYGFSKTINKIEHPSLFYRCTNFVKRRLGI